MPRNGSGQYNPPTNTWNPPVTGVLATGADFQAQLNDISTAITQSVSKDGQTPMTASLPLGNNSIVGIAAGTAAAPSISANGDANTGVYFPAADTVAIAAGGTERARITSNGNLLVGTTVDSGYRATFSGGSSAGGTSVDAILLRNSGYGGSYISGINENNLVLSQIDFATEDIDSNVFDDGLIRFITRRDAVAGGALTEGARITSAGNLLVGTTSAFVSGTGSLLQVSSPGTGGTIALRNSGSTSGKHWRVGPDSATNNLVVYNQSGQGVYLLDGGTSWVATSDERMKDIIEPITDAAVKVSSLRAVIGKYKTDAEGTRRAFLIAQDVQAVLPEAVNVQNDEEGTLGISYTETIPLLVAAIKEQQALIDAQKTAIESLTARITALEAK